MSRALPYAPEAEVSVLGGCLIEPDGMTAALELVRADDFYHAPHRRIFAAMAEIARRGAIVDPVTVTEELTLQGALGLVGGVQYLAQLMDAVPTAANLRYHANIVRDRAHRRRLIEAASSIAEDAYSTDGIALEQLLDSAETRIFAVAEGATTSAGPAPIGDLMHGTFEMLEAQSGNALPTGLRDLDEKLAIRPGNFLIIGGATSMGKSALGFGIAVHTAVRQRKPVLVFSVEMTKEENVVRALASEAMVDLGALITNRAGPDEMARVANAVHTLRSAPLWIDDEARTAIEMRARARRLKAEHPDLALIVVDHIHDMAGPGEERRHQVGGIGRDLKRLAKELHVPVIALAQLSRKPAERNDHRPQISDLFEAGDLEQVADAIVLVYRPEYYHGATITVGKGKDAKERDVRGMAEAIIGKQRNGKTGSVELYFRDTCARFEDYARAQGGLWGGAAA